MRNLTTTLSYLICRLLSAVVGPFRLASLLTVCYWGAMFVGTHMPATGVDLPRVNDKLMHLTAFAGLALLLAWAIPTHRAKPLAHLKWTALIALVYGVLDECSQALVPGRSPDIRDYAADVAGIVIGLAIYTALRFCFASLRSGKREALRIFIADERRHGVATRHADCNSTDHDSINVA